MSSGNLQIIRKELNHPFWWLMLLSIPAFWLHLGLMPLMADEPIRALVALEMELSGQWLVPHVNGLLYLNKPPLYNWILLALFKLSQSHSELLIRLPSILSLYAMMWLIWKQCLLNGLRREIAFVSAFAFATTGNLLFYSSLLGHIDLLYSLVHLGGFFVIYHHFNQQKWWQLFLYSWLLTAIGFMLKGYPSLVFQGFTLLAWFIHQKAFKKLFHPASFIGLAMFLLLVGSYFLPYHQQADAFAYLQNLWSESSSRTIAEKSFWQSIEHLFKFPLDFVRDTLPWGLLLAILVTPSFRTRLWQNEFYRFCLITLGANIVIYWLSPDNRARYLFMLMPLFIIPFIGAFFDRMEALNAKQLRRINTMLQSGIGLVAVASALLLFVLSHHLNMGRYDYVVAAVLMVLPVLFEVVFRQEHHLWWVKLLFILLSSRILFNITALPERAQRSYYSSEKKEALQIAEITQNEPLAMYHSNVHLNMAWYMTLAKQQVVPMKTKGFQLEEWYLCPADVLHDPSNEDVQFEFVRRFEQKPFKLLKFNRYFPKMPEHPKASNEHE